MDASLILTYRCNSKCDMCHTWKYPTKKEDEITIKDIEKLPQLNFVNITGGEPFLRDDIADIIGVIKKKCKRMVISTHGMMTDRIVSLFKKHKDIGIRISMEGFPKSNEAIRGIPGGFEKSFRTLVELKSMGIKDLGIGITVSDKNAKDLVPLFKLAQAMNVEFAIAVAHNSYYFHKMDNVIEDKDLVAEEYKKLIKEYLNTRVVKNWYRAYMASGIIDHIYGRPRLLPCEMGIISFFLDPLGEIRPCNVMEETMGNIKEKSFDEIWNSKKAERVREKVRHCDKNCWMIGSVSCIMRKKIWIPTFWILRNRWGYGKRLASSK